METIEYKWIFCNLTGEVKRWELAHDRGETLYFPRLDFEDSADGYEDYPQHEVPLPGPAPSTESALRTGGRDVVNLRLLDEHNREMERRYGQLNKCPRLTGVACPECGTELVVPEPSKVLLTYPPKQETLCPKCGYTGYIIV